MEFVKMASQLKEVRIFLKGVFNSCVKSVIPKSLLLKELKVSQDELVIRGVTYALKNNCYLVGFGKAVLDMAQVTEQVLNGHLKKGILSIPVGINHSGYNFKYTEVYEGAKNNIPDENAVHAAKKIVELIKPLTEKDILIVLISGGGSALLPYPVPPVSITDKTALTKLLLNLGANIVEINTVRKKLSLVKGGKLVKLAYPAQVVAFVLSDVIGDSLEFIASGPTVPDTMPKYSGIEVLKKYDILGKIPQSVIEVLTKEDILETGIDYFRNASTYIIGNNDLALAAGMKFASKYGYNCHIMTNCLQGKVENIAVYLAKLATLLCQSCSKTITKEAFKAQFEKLESGLRLNPEAKVNLANLIDCPSVDKLCLLFGGETLIEVKGNGKGGRNQELALRFAVAIDDISNNVSINKLFNIVLLTAGTDGIDGPTDAAGAFGYNGQTIIAKEQSLNYDKYLSNNDTYMFYSKLNQSQDLLQMGHTGTNVMDITILTIQSKTNVEKVDLLN